MKKLSNYYSFIFKGFLVFFITVFLSTCDSTEPLFDDFEPNGSYTLRWADLPKIDKATGIRLGGFSGLYYGGGRTFYTITDRGPLVQNSSSNVKQTYLLLPDFTPRIVKLELQDNNSIKISDQIIISNPLRERTSGRIPMNSWNAFESFTNPNNSTDDWGIYPSGILMDIDNNFFWFSDQYYPGLYQVSVDGIWRKRIRPAEGMRRAFGRHTVDGGLSGVDFTTGGDLVTIMSKCLELNIAEGDNSSEMNFGIRRIGLIDQKDGTDESMFYFVESESYDGIPEKHIKLGDIATVNDTSYLVTEYGQYNNIERNLLYMVVVSDTTTKALVGLEGIEGKTFETLSEASWRKNEITSVKKKLLLDLSSTNISRPEGIAIVDAEHVAIIDNNNYGIKNGNVSNGEYEIEAKSILLEILKLPKRLDLK